MNTWPQVRLGTRAILLVAVAVAVATFVTLSPRPAVPIASAEQPGDSLPTCAPGVQFLGFSDALNKTSFSGFGVVELSGLTYDRQRKLYYAVADRGDVVQSHFFTLDIPVGSESLGVPTVLDVTVLKNASGSPFNGFTFDGEGIVLTRHDELLVASEGGSGLMGQPPEQPEIRRFSLEGEHLGELAVPSRFLIGTNNLSFESLALSPNGHSLFTANERPLPAVGPSPTDGQTADLRNRIRILRYKRGPGGFVPHKQYFYLTEPNRPAAPNDVGVVEIIALSEEDLLVLERGFKLGEGNTVSVFHVSVEDAADVSDEPTLAAAGLVPVAKTLVFDLANCPPSGATIPPGATQPNALLDNFEAMTLGPKLPGGRRTLLLLSDDNAGATQTTRFIALAVDLEDDDDDDDDD